MLSKQEEGGHRHCWHGIFSHRDVLSNLSWSTTVIKRHFFQPRERMVQAVIEGWKPENNKTCIPSFPFWIFDDHIFVITDNRWLIKPTRQAGRHQIYLCCHPAAALQFDIEDVFVVIPQLLSSMTSGASGWHQGCLSPDFISYPTTIELGCNWMGREPTKWVGHCRETSPSPTNRGHSEGTVQFGLLYSTRAEHTDAAEGGGK